MKKPKQKETATEIRVDFGKSVTLSAMSAPGEYPFRFFDETGSVIEPTSIEIGITYPRKNKGSKVVTRSRSEPSEMSLDPNWNLVRFKTLLALDTNTIEVDGTKISVCASVIVREIKINKEGWSANVGYQDAFEFHDAKISPEQVGWWEAIERIKRTEIPKPVGIITDFDLNSLTRINSRKRTYIEGQFVPKDLEFIYGSADTGKSSYIANAAMHECDKQATRVLRLITSKSHKVFQYNDFKEADWFSRFQYWAAPTKA